MIRVVLGGVEVPLIDPAEPHRSQRRREQELVDAERRKTRKLSQRNPAKLRPNPHKK